MAAEESRRAVAAALVARHGRAVLEIGALSAIGIVATAGFQIIATRGLGPEGFGLLAAFLALVNIAAIGSAALRNSIAVEVARSASPPLARQRWLDSSFVESLALGTAFTIALLLASPWLATSLQSNSLALVLSAATIIPYFLFARSLGLLQGVGRSRAVVLWSTGAQVVQLILAFLAITAGAGSVGVLAICLVTIVLASIGSTLQSIRRSAYVTSRPFTIDGTAVVLITISFAWLTNVDVVLVRAGASELMAGSYAAAAVLVKTTLILPATLSLYLLPKFVTARGNSALTRLGVYLIVALTAGSGLVIFAALAVFGRPIVSLLYGPGFEATVQLLPALALMWLPWAMTQAVLVRITAMASKSALVMLIAAAPVQWVVTTLVLPDVALMIAVNTAIGWVTFMVLFAIHHFSARRPEAAR